MDFEQLDADEKFWKTPELVERLVSMLGTLSTLHLIQAGVVDKGILQKGLSLKAWSKIISQSSYREEGLLQKEGVKDLVKVLHFLELEEPSTFVLPLLDLICKSGQDQPIGYRMQLVCPTTLPDSHSVTDEAFLLLEEVEGSFGTAEQSIESMSLFSLEEPLLSALSLRVARQRAC